MEFRDMIRDLIIIRNMFTPYLFFKNSLEKALWQIFINLWRSCTNKDKKNRKNAWVSDKVKHDISW